MLLYLCMREIVVGKNDIRLDKFLLEQFPALTFTKLAKALKTNKIKVNNKKVPLNTRLYKGDILKLFILDDELTNAPKLLDPSHIIFEDKNILVAFKEPGLISIDDDPEVDSLNKRIKTYLQTDEGSICHRLDTGTSGLLIFAKNEPTEEAILSAIKNHKLQKFYRCVTFGWPKENSGTITNYLKKEDDGFVKVYNTKVDGSKEAITKYTVLKKMNELAYLDVELLTGRTHQIRVHLKSLGCPILGDSKYGNESGNRKYKKKRQCLCAYKIIMPTFDGELSYLSKKVFKIPAPTFNLA